MTGRISGWFERRLAVAAEQVSEDLRAEAARQGWPQPPIRAHRRYWVTARPHSGSGT